MRKNSQVELLVALLCAASMWFYVQRVLIPYERTDSAAHQRPRGNLSDLYPRWLGARELLLHHRNPYGDDIAGEIQKGYYGRELDPARPDDPKDRQGFAYPVYVVFVLAPLIGFPFHAVQIFFYWLLVGLTAASVWLWLRALRWELPPLAVASCIAFTLGSFPAVQGIKLQQLSMLVAALLAASLACVASGFLFFGGALLALATIKPQLAWPLVAWLLLWAVSDWRTRRKFVFSFALAMVLLLGGAEIFLPGWWRMFAAAIGQYHQYTQNQSVLEVILNQLLGSVASSGTVVHVGAQILSAIAILACVPVLWNVRRERADVPGFGAATALMLALTVLVIPMYAPYNQVLLLPAILLLVRERSPFTSRSRALRAGYAMGIFVLAWQWIASLCLSAIYMWDPTWALSRWQWPFFATFALPVLVFVLILLDAQRMRRAN